MASGHRPLPGICTALAASYADKAQLEGTPSLVQLTRY
ncbi:hypothetical protein GcM1_250075 [Golovinomyces cichoracearum]|uniref:Uncharacterized protein n=1 Tax=Golovinomyces cichoracearum TaxID=62708 RepID=A0A420IAQ1_9PEZI|nr:hypothetical protein GcM1_250075 [Golovinomyces cichoracearum]